MEGALGLSSADATGRAGACPSRPRLGNEIDRFIRARLAGEQLAAGPAGGPANPDPPAQLRLDRSAPAPAEVEPSSNDTAPDAYERLVDRLLASPHFGERMAIFWLDLVRFADTTGYHGDNHVDLYLFRDYVIRSFNTNKPFDRFTIEQLAGDLIDGATDETRIASGYNRLLQTTQEGGAQAKEYMAKYSADRVRNVSTVWLGGDDGLRRVPRPQVRPVQDPRVLQPGRVLRRHQGNRRSACRSRPGSRRRRRPKLCDARSNRLAPLKAIKKPSRSREARAGRAGKTAESSCIAQIPTSLVSTSVAPRADPRLAARQLAG